MQRLATRCRLYHLTFELYRGKLDINQQSPNALSFFRSMVFLCIHERTVDSNKNCSLTLDLA